MGEVKTIIKALYVSILDREVSLQELDSRMASIGNAATELTYLLDLVSELVTSSEFRGRAGLSSSSYEVHDVDVYYAYKFLLGRLPEGASVYSDKKNSATVEELLKVILTSEEFKGNSVLKDTISIKRKPVGFDATEIEKRDPSRKKIIVLSGCQGKTLADFFQVKSGLSIVPSVFMGGNALVDFVRTEGNEYLDLLTEYDLIYTQKRAVFEILERKPETRDQVRFMPVIEYTAFQPDQVYVIKNDQSGYVIGPLGEYQSLIVAASYFAGYSESACENMFSRATYEMLGYYSRAHSSRVDLIAQEEWTGYPLARMMTKWDKTGKWMRTINHPKIKVLNDLVDYALRLEDIDIQPHIEEYVNDDLASNADWPVYPHLFECEFSDEMFRFKMPHALLPKSNVGGFLNLKAFISTSYESLAEISLSQIHCKQLNREVDIVALVERFVELRRGQSV